MLKVPEKLGWCLAIGGGSALALAWVGLSIMVFKLIGG